ncbi:MAG: hypothetical protein HPY45_03410 [Anaerolineae bacterium]|nr:hypothetical protein [Anaerolineae bacterium]
MPRDLREYMRQTNIRLIVGAILLLFTVGIGLIYWFYGQGAAGLGIICLLAGLAPIALIYILFWIIDWIIKTSHKT